MLTISGHKRRMFIAKFGNYRKKKIFIIFVTATSKTKTSVNERKRKFSNCENVDSHKFAKVFFRRLKNLRHIWDSRKTFKASCELLFVILNIETLPSLSVYDSKGSLLFFFSSVALGSRKPHFFYVSAWVSEAEANQLGNWLGRKSEFEKWKYHFCIIVGDQT